MLASRNIGIAQDDEVGLRALLRRCRHALAVGAPEWERDVETAMESDAALVAEIDAAIGT